MRYLFGCLLAFSAIHAWGTEPENPTRVQLDVGKIHVEADRLKFQNQRVHAEGNISCSGKSFYMRGDSVECDLKTKEVLAENVDVNLGPFYARAKSAHFVDNYVQIHEADICVHAGVAELVPHFRSKKVTYDQKKKRLHVGHPRLALGKHSLIPLPSVVVGEWIRSLEYWFDAGYTEANGVYVRNDLLYRVTKELSVGALLDIYTKRGVCIGPRIKLQSDSADIKGRLNVSGGFLSDRGKRGVDIDGRPIKKRRWFLDVAGNFHLGERIDWITDALWASDSRWGKDFSRTDEEDSLARDSFTEFDLRGDQTLTTLFFRGKVNRYQRFRETMPSARFEVFPKELGDTGIYGFGFVEASRLREKDETTDETIECTRVDSYVGINRPIEVSGYHFLPKIGARWTGDEHGGHRLLGEIGIDANTEFWTIGKETLWFKAAEWKHIIRPTLQYRYITGRDRRWHPKLKRKRQEDFLPVIGLDQRRDVERLGPRSVLRLGLENELLGKTRKGKIKELIQLDVYQDFEFKRQRDANGKKGDILSNFYFLTTFRPNNWLELQAYTKHHWKPFTLDELNLQATVTNGDAWKFGVFTKMRRNKYQQVGFNCSLPLNAFSEIGLESRFDVKHGRFVSLEIYYDRCYAGLWDLHFFCKIRNRSKRNGRIQPGFLIRLLQW